MLSVFNLGLGKGRFAFDCAVEPLIALGEPNGDELPVLSAYVGRV